MSDLEFKSIDKFFRATINPLMIQKKRNSDIIFYTFTTIHHTKSHKP